MVFYSNSRGTHPMMISMFVQYYRKFIIYRLLYKKGGFPGYPKFVYGDGDGTVNKRSLEGCTHWSSVQKQPVYHQTFPDMDHMQVLSDSRVIEYIRKLFVTKL